MQDNGKKKKKDSGSGLAAIIILAAIYVFNGLAGRIGGSGLVVLIALAFIVIVFAAVFIGAVVKKKKNVSGTWAARTPASFIRQQIRTDDFRPARAAKPDCDYGNVNHRYSHDLERRIAQLDGFLKNGIISRDEYQVLLERYKKSASIEL